MFLAIIEPLAPHGRRTVRYRCDVCDGEYVRRFSSSQIARLTHSCSVSCAARVRPKQKRHKKACEACKQPYMGLVLSKYCGKCFRLRNTCRAHGLTRAKRHEMVELQDGKCAICRKSRELVIDHNHRTDAVRGLLCRHCNSVLGMVERPDWLKAAQEYLQRTSNYE